MLTALVVTRCDKVFAARPLPCPSASTTEKPPCGLSTTSTVSPLSRLAYLFVLAMASCTSSIVDYGRWTMGPEPAKDGRWTTVCYLSAWLVGFSTGIVEHGWAGGKQRPVG